jgi:hypothetical protein
VLCTAAALCTANNGLGRMVMSEPRLRFDAMFRAFRFSTDAGAYWSVFDEGTDELSRRQTGSSNTCALGAVVPSPRVSR